MLETIITLAVGFLDDTPSQAEQDSLRLLSQAALDLWGARLRSPWTPNTCAAFIPAAAFTALAAFLTARGASAPLTAMSAGDVSLHYDHKDMPLLLHGQAERLMAPYVQSETFAFRGVPG